MTCLGAREDVIRLARWLAATRIPPDDEQDQREEHRFSCSRIQCVVC